MISPHSVLYVPASRPDLVAKVAAAGADAAILDLEDTVPADEKESAREAVDELVAVLAQGAPGMARYLRINAADTPWFVDDVRTAAAAHVDAVVVPKVSSPRELAEVRALASDAGRPSLPIIAGIETARGVAAAHDIVSGRVLAVYFGADDFIADMGGRRSAKGTEVLYARSRVALAARIGDVAAFDQIVFNTRDDESFRADTELGASLGYTGKQCLHPRQVRLANEIYSPSADELTWAQRVLSAYDESVAAGQGVAVLDGVIVDMPAVRSARRILADGFRRTNDDPKEIHGS